MPEEVAHEELLEVTAPQRQMLAASSKLAAADGFPGSVARRQDKQEAAAVKRSEGGTVQQGGLAVKRSEGDMVYGYNDSSYHPQGPSNLRVTAGKQSLG